MSTRPLATPDQVAENVRRFAGELRRQPLLAARLGQVHAWYALFDDGKWHFGPSKFVGYADNDAANYLATYRNAADGRETERQLERWFTSVDPESALGRELSGALSAFLAGWGRTPRTRCRISVVGRSDSPESPTPGKAEEIVRQRIAIDPKICGGRPRIAGTRVRVSDIVEMMAGGAAREEILADYPYLRAEDIEAALRYAAGAAAHRIIVAA